MMRLHINIDHVATLRNQRDAGYPDLLEAARFSMEAGAHGITVHLREDRRHVRDDDVRRLRKGLPGLLNLEMAATSEMARIAAEIGPDVITLVPEKREERTTEGGLDVVGSNEKVREVAQVCDSEGIKLSLFIEADADQIRASRDLGARQIELHTGHYCDAPVGERRGLLDRLQSAAELGSSLGLDVAAGHGLNVENVGPIAKIDPIVELNIGHSVVCAAVMVGLPRAVQDMWQSIVAARGVAGRADSSATSLDAR